MPNRAQISAAVLLAAVIWALLLLSRGVPVTWDHFAPFTAVVSILAGIALVMELFLWRMPIIQKFVYDRPDIRGTWKVMIQSEWKKDGERIPPITAYAAITQTGSKLEIHLLTPESESCLLAYSIKPSTCASRFEISIAYSNTPHISLRGVRSERHIGAAVIATHGAKKYKPSALEGDYWTDRMTIGRLEFSERENEIFSRFVDAKAYFEAKASP